MITDLAPSIQIEREADGDVSDDEFDAEECSHVLRLSKVAEIRTIALSLDSWMKEFNEVAISQLEEAINCFCIEARKLLVDSYVALCRGDTNTGSRVAYRMTVRQLEALIRLSEGIARSHLDIQILSRKKRFLPRRVIIDAGILDYSLLES
ncbi:hypothetical protein ACFE04_003597 [Oxalis oulophora]